MTTMLEDLKAFLIGLSSKLRQIFVDGLNSNIVFWKQENTFDYSKTVTYKYGDFIHYDLGCNVGSEQGGKRYGIVVEDTAQLSRTVLVVPIHGCNIYHVPRHFEAYVNKTFHFLSKPHHYAVVTQMRVVSKIRIRKKHGKIDTASIDNLKKTIRKVLKV